MAATGVVPVNEMASLQVAANTQADPETPNHRSHDPDNNQKRSDPFQFGSRYLNEGDDVFEFNAWDHVETDDAYKEYAEEQFEKQRQAPVSDFDKSKCSAPFLLFPKLAGTVMMKKVMSSENSLMSTFAIYYVFRSHLSTVALYSFC